MIFFELFFPTRKRAKHEITPNRPLSYDLKMAADGYKARKALVLREVLYETKTWLRIKHSYSSVVEVILAFMKQLKQLQPSTKYQLTTNN